MNGDSSAAGALPAGACDCQIHIFGDDARFPPRHKNPLYPTPAATIDDAQAMHAALGVERFCMVQATVYHTDHSLIFDALSRLPHDRVQAVAVIEEDVTDAELQRMHDAGFRGARFNFQKKFGLVPSFDAFHKMVARIHAMGWFAKVFVGPSELPEVAPELVKTPATIVLDHMCRLDFGLGVEQPMLKHLLEVMKREQTWVMLSNGHRSSVQGAPWDDAAPFGRALFRAAPDRCIWGTDWPHVLQPVGSIDDGALVGLLRRYLDQDEAALKKVLVENPARLFGF
jgi:predicted TIM-barrel fold metal-dependent hydrolase